MQQSAAARRLFLETGFDANGKGILIPFGSLDAGFNVVSCPDTLLVDCIATYLSKHTSTKSMATRTNEKTYFKCLSDFLSAKGVTLVNRITCEDMNEYKKQLLLKVKPATVNRQFNTLRNFFNICLKNKKITENPCCEVTADQVAKPKIHLWTTADYEAVKAALDRHTASLFEFMWLTGARNIEAVSLTWEDVRQEDGYMILRSRKSKGHERQFPIGDSVSRLLHKRADSQHVFVCSRGYAFTSDSFGKRVREAVNAVATNKAIHPYSMRHTFCRDLLKKGFSRPQVQELMGHVDWRTTENYKHWENKTLADAVNSIR